MKFGYSKACKLIVKYDYLPDNERPTRNSNLQIPLTSWRSRAPRKACPAEISRATSGLEYPDLCQLIAAKKKKTTTKKKKRLIAAKEKINSVCKALVSADVFCCCFRIIFLSSVTNDNVLFNSN